MNHYDRDNILDLCSRSHRLASSLARQVGVEPEALNDAEQGLRSMAEKVSQALCNLPLYTVSVIRISGCDELEHETILTTPVLEEARRLRDDVNGDLPLFGSKRIAQITYREVHPRRWELWDQVSEDEIHLRCQITNARALLRSPGPDVLVRLYCGKTLAQDRTIFLQSERIEASIDFVSTRQVSFTKGEGRVVTHEVKVCTPSVVYLDVRYPSELTVDALQGVVATFPIENNVVILPGPLARALRRNGSALLLADLGNGRVRSRLTDRELLKRLELSRPRSTKRLIVPFLPDQAYPPALMAA